MEQESLVLKNKKFGKTRKKKAGEEKQKIVTMTSIFDIITNIERKKKRQNILNSLILQRQDYHGSQLLLPK